MRLIDADAQRMAMYHEAMEKDSDMQRWDSGCWIRYKLFERVLDAQPTIDAVPVIRCKDCKHDIFFPSENVYKCLYSDFNMPEHYCGYAEPTVDLRKVTQDYASDKTIDAVPVIRCRDCRHATVSAQMEHDDGSTTDYYLCNLWHRPTEAEGFCHRAEGRSDDD